MYVVVVGYRSKYKYFIEIVISKLQTSINLCTWLRTPILYTRLIVTA